MVSEERGRAARSGYDVRGGMEGCAEIDATLGGLWKHRQPARATVDRAEHFGESDVEIA